MTAPELPPRPPLEHWAVGSDEQTAEVVHYAIALEAKLAEVRNDLMLAEGRLEFEALMCGHDKHCWIKTGGDAWGIEGENGYCCVCKLAKIGVSGTPDEAAAKYTEFSAWEASWPDDPKGRWVTDMAREKIESLRSELATIKPELATIKLETRWPQVCWRTCPQCKQDWPHPSVTSTMTCPSCRRAMEMVEITEAKEAAYQMIYRLIGLIRGGMPYEAMLAQANRIVEGKVK